MPHFVLQTLPYVKSGGADEPKAPPTPFFLSLNTIQDPKSQLGVHGGHDSSADLEDSVLTIQEVKLRSYTKSLVHMDLVDVFFICAHFQNGP